MSDHLTPLQLLAYVDGELSRAETRRATRHLQSCWTCLTEMERLKGDITLILDAQADVNCLLPPPPRPWAGFNTLLARCLPAPRDFGNRLNPFLYPLRILATSAVLAVLLVGGYSFVRTRPVSAKEVMRRVLSADEHRSAITQGQAIRERVYIRKIAHGEAHPKLTHVDVWKSQSATYWDVESDDPEAVELQAQYRSHKIPEGLPLSAASVDSWSRAAGGSSSVAMQGPDVDVTFSRAANGADGGVERVDLLVRQDTWTVKQLILDFEDASFEVTEDEYSTMSASEIPAVIMAHLNLPVLPFKSVQPAVRPVAEIAANFHLQPVNLDNAELNVLATLRSLGADLGEPISVSRSAQAVHVGLWELPVDRQNELRTALAGKAGVQVDLVAPVASPQSKKGLHIVQAEAPKGSVTPLRIQAVSNGEDPRLRKYFGSAEREQDFTSEALATSTAMLSHLYALRDLEMRFPAERSSSLTPEQRERLHTLIEDHATAISANRDALSRQIEPIDEIFRIAACASPAGPTAKELQARAIELLQTGRLVDHLLRALLTASDTPEEPDFALPEIQDNLCRLQAELRGITAQ